MEKNTSRTSIYDSKEIFEAYLNSTDEKQQFTKWFSTIFGEPKAPVKIADLGCNDGALTLSYLEAIAGRIVPCSFIKCVDESMDALNRFRAKKLPSTIHFDFVLGPVHGLLYSPFDQFDWMIASHSLYWVGTLEWLVAEMKKKATNLVFAIREPGGLHEIESKFWNQVRKTPGPLTTAADLESALRGAGLEFQRHIIQCSAAIPPQSSPEFRRLVAFLLDAPVEQIDDTVASSVAAYLRQFGDRLPYGISFFWAKSRPNGGT